jgi:hypothetical protein
MASLYERILEERKGTRPANPVLRYYFENGCRSLGDGYRYNSLKKKYPEAYGLLRSEATR